MKNLIGKISNNQNNDRPEDRKPNRERQFRGYYVEVPPGGDALRSYRKIKRMLKENRVMEELRDRQHFQKPSAKRREAKKQRRQVLARLKRERNILYGNVPQKNR